MISTKSVYVRWLATFMALALVCGALAIASHNLSLLLALALCLIIAIINVTQIIKVKKLEKQCKTHDAKFVGVEKATAGWKNPRFSVIVEFELGDKKIRMKTRGIYFARDISGLTDESVIRIGYTEVWEQAITL